MGVAVDRGTVVPQRREIELAGAPTAVLEWEGGADRTPVLFVHGADGSAANFWDLAPLLCGDRSVYAVDLPGFGRSRVAGRGTSMGAYADLVGELVPRLPGGRAIVVGNSMGGPVSTLAAVRRPDRFAGLGLLAPALPRAGRGPVAWGMVPMLIPFGVPGLMGLEARRRHSQEPRERVGSLLSMCYAPGSPGHSDAAFEEMVAVARERRREDQVRAWTSAFRSLLWSLVRRSAFHREAAKVRCPVLIIEGASDPIIPASSIGAALERNPGWRHARLDGVGHVPQLEDSPACARALLDWFGELEKSA